MLYSGASGYTNAKPGAKLVSGSQISTGENASAKISVGSNCKLPIGANSIATITQQNNQGDILVSIANQLDTSSELVQEGSSTQQVDDKIIVNGKVLIAVASAAAVGGIIWVVFNEKSASP